MNFPDVLAALVKDYKKLVVDNVGAVTEVESLLKLASYFISGGLISCEPFVFRFFGGAGERLNLIFPRVF